MLIIFVKIAKNEENVNRWKEILVAYKGVCSDNLRRKIYFTGEVVICIRGMDLTNKVNLDDKIGLERRVVRRWHICKCDNFNRCSNARRDDTQICVVYVSREAEATHLAAMIRAESE